MCVCVCAGVFLKRDFEITFYSTDLYQDEGLTQTRLLEPGEGRRNGEICGVCPPPCRSAALNRRKNPQK